MRYRVRHKTTYSYERAVTLCYNEARLAPRNLPSQKRVDFKMQIEPEAVEHRERSDYFGNRVHAFSVREAHERFVLLAESLVSIDLKERSELPLGPSWETARDRLAAMKDPDARLAIEYAFDSAVVGRSAELAAYAGPSFAPGRPIAEAAADLMERIHADFEFDPEATSVTTRADEVLKAKGGVCQDFAHLAIGALRSIGLAARYVSGYLETLAPPGKEKLAGADASHAWFAIWVPDFGWIDFDPTNAMMPAERHVTVAFGRDYADVTPLRGVIFGGGDHTLDVAVDVERVEE